MPRPYIGVGALSPESLVEGEVSGRSFEQHLLVAIISRCCLLTKQHLLLQQEIKTTETSKLIKKTHFQKALRVSTLLGLSPSIKEL